MNYEQKLERIQNTIDLIVENYFRRGELSLEVAFAWAIFLQTFVEELRGVDGAEERIKELHIEDSRCYHFICPEHDAELRGGDGAEERIKEPHMEDSRCYHFIYPEHDAIEKHLEGLIDLQEMLVKSYAERDTILAILPESEERETNIDNKVFYLKLVHSRDH